MSDHLLAIIQARIDEAIAKGEALRKASQEFDLINGPLDELHELLQEQRNQHQLQRALNGIRYGHVNGHHNHELRSVRSLQHYFEGDRQDRPAIPLDARLEANIIVMQRKLDESVEEFREMVSERQRRSGPLAALGIIHDRRGEQYAIREMTGILNAVPVPA